MDAPPIEQEQNVQENEDTEELAAAKAELASLSPQDYLDMMQYIERLEKTIPEAPIAVNFFATHPDGWNCQFTLRDMDDRILFARFKKISAGLIEHSYEPKQVGQSAKASPPPSAPPSQSKAPAAPPTAGQSTAPQEPQYVSGPEGVAPDEVVSDMEMFEVTSVAHQVSANGTHTLKVKGGTWQKYGWVAWPEVIPSGTNYESWPVGTEYAPTEDLAIAWVDKGKKKITTFQKARTR